MSKKVVKNAKSGQKTPKKRVKKLSAREENFCQSYLIDFNGARAAREAGYSDASARESAHKLLTKAHIQARIHALREEMGKNFNITRERIAQEYAKMAFGDIRNAFDEEGNLIPIAQLTEDTAAQITAFEVANLWEKDEDNRPVISGEVKKVKLSDRRAALDSLTRLMGYAAPEKAPVDPEGKAVIPAVHMHIVQPVKDPDDE